jgi:hypothetical protein
MKPTLVLSLFTCAAYGADLTAFGQRLADIAKATTPAARQTAVDQLLGDPQTIVTGAFAPKLVLPKLVRQYHSMRNDAQTGSSGSTSGGTSLVLNPYLADILGVSFESGAILKTVSGNTINLQIKPAGIFCAAKNSDPSKAAPGTDCMEFWKRVGITAAFDTSRSNAPSQLVALKNDFSEFRVHFDLLQPLVSKAKARLVYKMMVSGPESDRVRDLFGNEPKLIQWKNTTSASLLGVSGDTADQRMTKLQQVMSNAIDSLVTEVQSEPSLREAHAAFIAFANLNLDAIVSALEVDRLDRTSFAVEYALNRPDVATAMTANSIVMAGQRPPDLSTARLIYARNYQPLVITANAQLSWFNQILPGMDGHFRDWQISAAATFLLKEIPNFGKTTLSFGGLAGNLHQQPLGFDYTVPLVNDPTKTQKIDLKGTYGAFNARLEFPTANKSVTIPFSFTWASRTDLNKESDVRGSVGITLRFDSLFPTKP